jgi:perosamine synthetase
MCKTVLLDAPNLGDVEKQYLTKAVESGFVSTVGPFVPEFEERFARFVGAKYAVAIQSGTAAIHIALYESGIGKDDEVIVPSLTFIATINPILYLGAKPVIVDVDRDTWNISPQEIEKAITHRTKAIIPVHLYGNPCDMDWIMEIAKRYGLSVIEDATESLGAIYKSKQTGTFGRFGCFSFNGNKLITTGGGGMVVTDDEESANHIKFLVNQARDSSKAYYHPEMGFNYRMTNIEAALGLAQLTKIDTFLQKKRAFWKTYYDSLNDLPFISFQHEYQEAQSSCWLSCIKVSNNMIEPEELVLKLKKKDIQSRGIFWPANQMPYLKNFSKSCPNSYDVFRKGLCLPSSTLNEIDEVARASLKIREVLTNTNLCK